ncbi:hypothetical protein Bbelb_093350 [Branchiostoma belcheri]|nr:hypothetical protein Bbelb_093350 [Branchiostoma belcheri]
MWREKPRAELDGGKSSVAYAPHEVKEGGAVPETPGGETLRGSCLNRECARRMLREKPKTELDGGKSSMAYAAHGKGYRNGDGHHPYALHRVERDLYVVGRCNGLRHG